MLEIIQFLLSCFYFFVPAYWANMTPPLVRNIPALHFLDVPVDFGRKLGNARIFGGHKTWRGVVSAGVVGMVFVLLQRWLYQYRWAMEFSLIDYKTVNIWLFGILLVLGVVLGDLAAAFIKRRRRLEPGAAFVPWDQTNYAIGCFVTLEPYLKLDLSIWITLFFMTFFLHLLFNRLGYDLGLHKAKW